MWLWSHTHSGCGGPGLLTVSPNTRLLAKNAWRRQESSYLKGKRGWIWDSAVKCAQELIVSVMSTMFAVRLWRVWLIGNSRNCVIYVSILFLDVLCKSSNSKCEMIRNQANFRVNGRVQACTRFSRGNVMQRIAQPSQTQIISTKSAPGKPTTFIL